MKDLVSIVVPAYNVEKYVHRCVSSIDAQEYENYEVIFVNDGSTDGTQKLLEEIVSQKPRYKLVNQENMGLSGARNTGIRHAKGEYIYFLDPDDWIEKDLLSKCIACLSEQKADMVFFDFYFTQSEVDHQAQFWFKNRPKSGCYPSDEALEFLLDCRIGNYAWSSVARTKIFTDNEIEFPVGRTYEDLATTYKLIGKSQKVYFLDDHLYYYYQNNNSSITKTWKYKDYLDTKESFGEIESYMKTNYPELLQKLVNLKLNMLFAFLDNSYGSQYCTKMQEQISDIIAKDRRDVSLKNKVKYSLLKTKLYFVIKKMRGQV
ncbi:glycosyltransferase family 2 protein [Ligilactobacillus animalis]|uniref:glycosyltransferase family 2 protein n=1 Tax=Ligilactobacillus animalis TaxID=1605 RepID=UPI0006F03046|nr:glycosyltransferase family 2 protein [Ligilactobacillus animalis]KRM57440.1 glycosyltransferase WchA [Ligilactobacillus animalis KCTC 3501 = DSM 20602]